MSYNEKVKSLPFILDEIKELLEKHKNERGIIHSGTYEISKAIYESLPSNVKSRIIFYNNAKGRAEAISLYKKFSNKILMGPSILEGLDFEGDLCRFIIIAKLPYASLGNNLVQAKMELYPNWYSYDCVNKITQGIGRGVRSENDYCSTYILDGCFADLVRRSGNLFSKTISSRFRRITF
jgi:Rad3-related DNA helicase